MIRWLVGQSLKLRFVLVAGAALLVYFGAAQLKDMPVDVLPEFSRPYVEIQTEALGLSAAEVEALITVPLEADMLNGMPWVENIHSESITGLSSIVLVFKPGTDILHARQMVQEHMIGVSALPNVSKPPVMLQPLSSTNRVMIIGLSSKNLSLIEQSVLARWTIRPRLMGVAGVANVSIWGERNRQLQVQVDPKQLHARGVTLNQVIKTAGNALWVSPLSYLSASTPGTGGFIDSPNQRLGVRHLSPISTAGDLAKVTVEGAGMRLGEVASVREDHQPLIGDAVVKDAPGLLLVVEKFPGANTLAVTEQVQKTLAAIQPGLSGLQFDHTIFQQATFIQAALSNLTQALLIGCALMVLVLGGLLYGWRSALVGLAAICLSLIAAGVVLYLRGVTMNEMVFAGLAVALGVVVDDAIVDVENVLRRLRQRRQEGIEKSPAMIILESSLEMRSAAVYATLIVALAAVPLFFLRGLSGAFLQPFASAYVLAVFVSMLVALAITPALSLILLGKASLEHRESRVMRWLRGGYDAIFSWAVRRPGPALAVLGLMVLAGVASLPWLRQESLLPAFKETTLLVELDGGPGASRPEMVRMASQIGRELRSLPGVCNVGAHVGRAILSDEAGEINSGELWVSIDPKTDYNATVAAIQELVRGYPGVERDVLTYLKQRTREALAETGEAVVVRIYGDDLGLLHRKAEEVRRAMAKIDGLVDLQVEREMEKPHLEVKVDLAKAKPHGLKPGDVRRQAATLLSGMEVGSLFEEQKVFEVVVWGAPQTRQSLTSIRELLIDKPEGGQVRLGDVAEVRVAPTVNAIKRESVSRRVDVTANVRGRDLGAVAADVQHAIQQVKFPLEYHAELLGEYTERAAAQKRIMSFGIAAAIAIFLLLQAAFGSWRLATVVFVTLPVSLAGAALAALLGGGILSLGSFVGFIAVFAIAARNAILLIHRYQDLQRREGEAWGPGLVLRGTRERAAPIAMTAAVVALALLPLLILGDRAGLELVHPMAVVILGGLVTSMVFNLCVLPALYLRFGSQLGPDAQWKELDAPDVLLGSNNELAA